MTATDPLLLDLPTLIESPRLLLRPPRTGDGPVLHQALLESLPELRRFLASLPWVALRQKVSAEAGVCSPATLQCALCPHRGHRELRRRCEP